ncbi:hypothetical protein [Bradyrhizobium elkanii]|uniref:Uncharacterized protein n=1 Tax=Bradyrhizobium elkanii TaxID=29448 RepID=A0A8I1YES6_BRAEL|nr:hypothetical protein [Bradyrhizobium elkanii]MBP1297405.1 hypothetical protein [Bradyrhizobium elkanii]
MNHRLMVSDPAIRKQLQLAGLRFAYSRARWLASETRVLGLQLKHNRISSAQADLKLEQLGVLDLVYPELMSAE